MRSRAVLGVLPGLLLVAGAVVGCGDDPVDVSSDSADQPAPSAAAPDPPSLGTDPYVVRDAILDGVRQQGARLTVSGSPAPTTVDLVYDVQRQRFARRFAWQEGGEKREVLQTVTGRVCANLAAARALEALGTNVQGAITASDRPWSCSTAGDGSVGAFVVSGFALRDPVTRLSTLLAPLTLTDLGVERDGDVSTRHVRLETRETTSAMREVPTTYDVWVDAEGRLVRMEFTNLDGSSPSHLATFDYGGAEPVAVPPAGQRGDLGMSVGTGVPGVGGMLLGQFCPDPEQPCPPQE